jgi:hypothetical protein
MLESRRRESIPNHLSTELRGHAAFAPHRARIPAPTARHHNSLGQRPRIFNAIRKPSAESATQRATSPCHRIILEYSCHLLCAFD